MQIGNIPLILFNFPSKESSPTKATSLSIFLIICKFKSIAIAIGKSKYVPSFLKSAGAKFTTILLLAVSKPEFFIAILTLSFASFTLASGRPNNFPARHSP